MKPSTSHYLSALRLILNLHQMILTRAVLLLNILLILNEQSSAETFVVPPRIEQNYLNGLKPGSVLVINNTVDMSSKLVFPEQIKVKFVNGGSISLNGYSARFNCLIEANANRIFTNQGINGTTEGFRKNAFVLPLWWGAIPDDTGNDLAAIQAALNTGRPVKLKQGKYILHGDDLELPSGAELNGDGQKETVLELYETQITTPRDINNRFIKVSDISISNLSIKKSLNRSDWDTGKYMVLIMSEYPEHTENIKFLNVSIYGGENAELKRNGGVLFSRVSNVEISNSLFVNLFECAVFIRMDSSKFMIRNNSFNEIYSNDGAVFIDGHHVGENVTFGQGSKNVTVLGNVFRNHNLAISKAQLSIKNPAIGIDNQSSRNTLKDNIVDGFSGGIYINSGSTENLIESNNIRNARYFGLLVGKSLSTEIPTSQNTIINNIFTNCGLEPINEPWNVNLMRAVIISVSGGLTTSLISGNLIENSTEIGENLTAGIYLLFGGNNIIQSNNFKGLGFGAVIVASSDNKFVSNNFFNVLEKKYLQLNSYYSHDSVNNRFSGNRFSITGSTYELDDDSGSYYFFGLRNDPIVE